MHKIFIDNNKRKMALQVKNREQLLALRNAPENLENLAKARQGDQKAKGRLLQLAYNLAHADGALAGCKRIGSYFFHDVDCYDQARSEEYKELILSKKDEIGLMMLERSASGGWHLVCKRVPGTTILENQVRIAMILHLEMDTSTKDLQRVAFATSGSEEDLPYLDDALFDEPMTAEECEAEYERLKERQRRGEEQVPPGAKKANKHYKPWEDQQPADSPAQGEAQADGATSAETKASKPIPAESPVGTKASKPKTYPSEYHGIPFTSILKKYWELNNRGFEPTKGDRDTLTYQLACDLRHICGKNFDWLDQVIPCYDGFPIEEKRQKIKSALSSDLEAFPLRLRNVLNALENRGETTDEDDMEEEEDDNEQQSTSTSQLPIRKMPQGIRDSINAVGPNMAMSAVIAVCPCIGALATGVSLDVHGTVKGLNLIAYVAGDFASGKGQIDPLIEAWISEMMEDDKKYLMQEDEWRAKKRAAKNKKEQPEEPKLPIRSLPLNNTVANIAERLGNTGGKHAFSFTPEADTMSQKFKSTMSDFSVMLRQSYDGSRYDREARSAEAVNVHIDHLLWNVTMCGTPDALYRVVSNYTDGFQSRLAIGRTPDNTFAPLEEHPHVLTSLQEERIKQVAHLLPLMNGEIKLPQLEAKGRQWLERIRLETLKDDDKVRARQRFRVCVTAQRMTCCLMLCKVCERLIKKHGQNGAEAQLKQYPNLWKEMLLKAQTPQLLDAFDTIADTLLENALFYFRDRITNAFASRDYAGSMGGERQKRGKNDTIFERLDHEFTFEQAMQQSIAVKGASVTHNSVRQMLKNWYKQGLIVQTAQGKYRKA